METSLSAPLWAIAPDWINVFKNISMYTQPINKPIRTVGRPGSNPFSWPIKIYDFEIDQGVDRQMRGLLLMTNALDARSGE